MHVFENIPFQFFLSYAKNKIKTWMEKVTRFCLFCRQFQPGVTYISAAYKKSVYMETREMERRDGEMRLSICKDEASVLTNIPLSREGIVLQYIVLHL